MKFALRVAYSIQLILGSPNMCRAPAGFTTPWTLGYHLSCPWYLLVHRAHSRVPRNLNTSTQTADNVHNHGGLRTRLNTTTQSLKYIYLLPQGVPMKLKLRMTQYHCVLCHSAFQASPMYLEGQQGVAGLSAEGAAIIHSMVPWCPALFKCPESLDLKGLLGTNTVAWMNEVQQTRLGGDRCQSHVMLSSQYLNAVVDGLSFCRCVWVTDAKTNHAFSPKSLLGAAKWWKDTGSKIWHLWFFSPPSMILLIDPCKHESSSQRTEVETALEVLSSAVGVQWLRLLLGTHFWFKYLMILIKQHFNFLCDPANDPLDPIMSNNGGNELEWGGLQFSPWVLQLCGAVVEHVSWTAAIHPVALRMTWCIKAIAAAGYFVSARCSALAWAWAVLRPGLFPS